MNINDDVAALRELLAKATPGPWTRKKPEIVKSGPGEGWPSMSAVAATPGRQTIYAACDRGSFPSADCDLIVAMRNALPALLDEREAMGELLAAQRAELCLAYDVIEQIPDSALDHVEDAKLLRLMQRMDEEQKRKAIRDKMDALATENERLRALLGEEKKT